MCMCILIRAHFHLLIDMHAYTGLLKHLHSSIQLPPGTCVAKGVMVKRRPPGLILPGGEELCYMAPGALLYMRIHEYIICIHAYIAYLLEFILLKLLFPLCQTMLANFQNYDCCVNSNS